MKTRVIGTILAHFFSGWSFFFRIPKTHVEPFRPNGIFLGPVLQAFVFGTACFFFEFFSQALGLKAISELRLFLASIVLAGLTGFFHEDGLADTADGLGVPRFDGSDDRIEKIRTAMKDSRIGSYGAIALIVLWILRFAIMGSALNSNLSVWSCIGIIFWSRLLGLGFASALLPQQLADHDSAKNARPLSLASHSLSVTSQRSRLAWSAALTLLGVVAFADTWFWVGKICFTGVAGACLLVWLSKRSQRLCGDLIGASICIMELLILLISQ